MNAYELSGNVMNIVLRYALSVLLLTSLSTRRCPGLLGLVVHLLQPFYPKIVVNERSNALALNVL